MNYLTKTVTIEKARIEYMLKEYKTLKATLIKGTIVPKTLHNKTYYYLKYRDGDRVISDYIHPDDLERIVAEIDHRKHIDIMIKALKEELAAAEKLLKRSYNRKNQKTDEEQK